MAVEQVSFSKRYWGHMLSKLTIMAGTLLPLSAARYLADKTYDRCEYIVKVLRASQEIRDAIQDECLSATDPGRQQLWCLLEVFNYVPLEDQKKFIKQYRHLTSMACAGSLELALANTWEPVPPGTHPPTFVP